MMEEMLLINANGERMRNKNSPNNSNNILFNEFLCAWIPNKMEKRTSISAWLFCFAVDLLVSQIVQNIIIIICIIRKKYIFFFIQKEKKRANKINESEKIRNRTSVAAASLKCPLLVKTPLNSSPSFFFFFNSQVCSQNSNSDWASVCFKSMQKNKKIQPLRSRFMSEMKGKKQADGNDDPKNVTYSPHSIFSFDS